MFNLETAIAEWRRQMLAAGISAPVPLEELEAHLREDIGLAIKSGWSASDAFEAASRRIGQASEVQVEFKKVGTGNDAPKWKRGQILIATVTSLFTLGIGGSVWLGLGNFSALTTVQRLYCLAAVGVFSMLVWMGWLTPGIFPVIRGKRNRDAFSASCCVAMIVWWVVFSRLILPGRDFNMGQLMVAILWEMIAPTGIFLGLTFGIENRARGEAVAGSA